MNQYRCETCKNWDNFYHGCNLYIHEARLDKKKEIIHPYMHEDAYKAIEFVGCASHSDFQNEREMVLDKFKEVIRLHGEDELLYPDLYNEFLVIYKSLRRQSEGGK